jgi:hypothetical protein
MDAEECRRQAEHYSACAKQMSDPSDKAALQDLAAYWTRMAEEAEQKGSSHEKNEINRLKRLLHEFEELTVEPVPS